jgi:hypothetical protein
MRIEPDPHLPASERLREVINQILFFYVGLATIKLLTVGQMKVKDDDDDRSPWWNPFWRMSDGRLAISESGASSVGFIVLMAAALAALAMLGRMPFF